MQWKLNAEKNDVNDQKREIKRTSGSVENKCTKQVSLYYYNLYLLRTKCSTSRRMMLWFHGDGQNRN